MSNAVPSPAALPARAGKLNVRMAAFFPLTIFMELLLPAQVKLLRALQEGEIERPATSTRAEQSPSASSPRPTSTCRRGQCRHFPARPVLPPQRLSGHHPVLRERTGDIPAPVEAMVRRFETLHGKRIAGLSDKADARTQLHAWLATCASFENVLERRDPRAPERPDRGRAPSSGTLDEHAREHSLSAQGGLETARRAQQGSRRGGTDLGMSLDAFEQRLLQHAVERANGNLSAAARLLGMTRPQLNYRIKKQGGKARGGAHAALP